MKVQNRGTVTQFLVGLENGADEINIQLFNDGSRILFATDVITIAAQPKHVTLVDSKMHQTAVVVEADETGMDPDSVRASVSLNREDFRSLCEHSLIRQHLSIKLPLEN